jgi:hypothetical protein
MIHEVTPACAGPEHRRLQGTIWHERFYAQFDALVRPLYLQFLKWLSYRFCVSGLVYQAKPSLRIHLPNDVAVHERHKDADYGHANGEVNIWLPITSAFDTSTIWIEDKPYNANYGDLVVFDGVNLVHGNKVNTTGKTRVSLDFRVAVPGFEPSGSTSVNAGRQFTVGPAYFEKL